MDVQDLAPALLALGDICRSANHILNGDSAEVRVLIRVDLEQECFQFEIQLVQDVINSLTTLLAQKPIQDAKNILEWLGIIAAPALGLFGLYKWLSQKGRAEASSTVEVSGEGGSIIYQAVGGGDVIVVPPEVHRLASDPKMLPAAKKVLGPLRRDGYDRFEFEHDSRITQYFTRDEAENLCQTPDDAVVVVGAKQSTATIRTRVGIKRPAYMGDAKWTVMYKRSIEAKMDDLDWLREFQSARVHAPPGSSLLVDLEEKFITDECGDVIGDPSYKIIKVHGVIPPSHQLPLFKSDEDDQGAESRKE